jgi:hypothetical protein
MALPVTIPNEFANATASIPLSQLDTNFSTLANVVNEINAGTQQLSNANVAILIVNAGTSAAPTITTTGDTNTGIFFPAADTIAFTEGGAEAMRIDASGNLGLGVTPVATWSGYKVLQAGIASFAGGSSGAYLLQDNCFTDNAGSTWKYINSSYAPSQYFAASGAHVWRTAPSGTAGNAISFTQAMTLDASGRLLIGTATSGSASGIMQTLSNSSASYTQWSKGNSGGGLIGAEGTGLWFYTHTGNIGSESYTERMRIDSSGNLLVGSTSGSGAGERLFVSASLNGTAQRIYNFSGSTPQGLYIFYPSVAPNSTASEFLICGDTSADRMVIRSNGGIANYSANDVNLSDRREKTNFAPAKNYLETICSIPVQTFNYIDQNLEEDDGLTLGVLAQDVQEVAPELVMESNWGTKEEPKMRLSIYQTDLQYALMKSIQELKAELDTVKAELATMKGN